MVSASNLRCGVTAGLSEIAGLNSRCQCVGPSSGRAGHQLSTELRAVGKRPAAYSLQISKPNRHFEKHTCRQESFPFAVRSAEQFHFQGRSGL